MPAMASFPKMVISIHTPARGVTGVARLAAVLDANFNPHSRKGSDAHQTIALCLMQYFNPHSRKGSDIYLTLLCGMLIISIHTPARGVTIATKWK